MIAMKDKKYIFSVGNEAYKMYEKAPENVEILFPMKNGVIARFVDMQYLLGSLLKTDHQFARGAEYMIAVPTDVTEVEKKAFYDLVMHSEAKGKVSQDCGTGTGRCRRTGAGCDERDRDFYCQLWWRHYRIVGAFPRRNGHEPAAEDRWRNAGCSDCRTGQEKPGVPDRESTAERLRKEFAVFEDGTEDAKRVYGRDLTSGVPAHTEIQISLVRAAVKEPLEECAEAIRSMLTRTPPDVRRAIEARGIYLTGGVAGLKGFPTYLGERTGLKVFTVPDPELCAVKGLQKIILDKEYYKKLSYSMLDQNYRWLR